MSTRSTTTAHGNGNGNNTESDDTLGIVCSRCECPDLRVVRTRKAWGGKVRRWRLCQNPNCGHEMVTTEVSATSKPDSEKTA